MEDARHISVIIVVLIYVKDFVLVLSRLVGSFQKLLIVIVILIILKSHIWGSHRLIHNFVDVLCVVIILRRRIVVVEVGLDYAEVLRRRAVRAPLRVAVPSFFVHRRSFIYLSFKAIRNDYLSRTVRKHRIKLNVLVEESSHSAGRLAWPGRLGYNRKGHQCGSN